MEPPSPRALILVRNTVTHDARILREAGTLRDLGYDVLIVGVVSTTERERELEIEGAAVVRLDPLGALQRLVPGRRSAPAGATAPAPAQAQTGAGDVARRPSPRATVRRLLITGTYYALGAVLVRRSSPRLVHANDFNTMWIGIAARLLSRSRVIYDCHELWADRNGRPEWRPWLVACEWLFMRLADATVTASPGYAEELARRYRVPRPVVVRNIPWTPERPSAHHAPESGLVAYVGGLMPGRGLEAAIRALPAAPSVRLRFIGPGNAAYRAALERCAAAAGVSDRVELRAPVPPSELLDAIAGATVGLMLIERTGRSYELTLPNKLFEYAAAGVPILASDMPVLAGVVSEAGIGEVVPVDDIAAIALGMERLASPDVNAAVRARVRAFAARETWDREREVLADVYEPGRVSDERRRVEGTYARYAASARKRRSWDAENPGNAAIRDELVDAVFDVCGPELGSARAVLDIGCGSGWWLEWLASRYPDVSAELVGVELQASRVAAARARVPSADVVEADARALPFEDGLFDVVSLFTALSSLSDRDDVTRALREAGRVLRPGGRLLVWEPRLPNPLNRRTLHVDVRLVRDALPGAEFGVRSTTLLPPLARRLGVRTERLYPLLVRLAPLRSHRLIDTRTPGGG